MKKILFLTLGVIVVARLVILFVVKQQSGYTKVLTAKLVRQDLSTVISGTGQIRPKTYVNVGATSFGRITHLYVKEGDHVKRGQVIATVESVQPEANVEAQKAQIESAKTDVLSYVAAEKTAEASLAHAPEVELFPRWIRVATKLTGKTEAGARKARILRYSF